MLEPLSPLMDCSTAMKGFLGGSLDPGPGPGLSALSSLESLLCEEKEAVLAGGKV